MFQSHGYAASSIDEISRIAGMSKATVYRWFANKEALFSGLVEHRGVELLDNCAKVEAGWPPATALESFLRRVARTVLSPRVVGLLRLVISEAPHCPEVARSFQRKSAERCQSIIATLLAQDPALVEDRDALGEVASLLYGAAITELQLRLLLGQGESPTGPLIDERVRRAIAACLARTL